MNQLAQILKVEQDNHILAVTIWALGQIGKHSPEHSKSVADLDVFAYILSVRFNFNIQFTVFIT